MLTTSTGERTLSQLDRGQTARVSGLQANGSIRRRFQDLGLIQGTLVECLGASPLGDPCAYLIRGAVIALRKSDADTVSIEAPFAASPAPAGIPVAEQAVGHGAF